MTSLNDNSSPTKGKSEAVNGKVGIPLAECHIAHPYANVKDSLIGMSRDDNEMSWGRSSDSNQESYGDEQQVYPLRKALSDVSLGSQFSIQSSDLRAEMLRDELRQKIQVESELRKELSEARSEVQSLVAARPLLKHVSKLRKTATNAIQMLRHKEKDKEKKEAASKSEQSDHEEVDLQAEEEDLFQIKRIAVHLNTLQEKVQELEKKRASSSSSSSSDEEELADFRITNPLRLGEDPVEILEDDTDDEECNTEEMSKGKPKEEKDAAKKAAPQSPVAKDVELPILTINPEDLPKTITPQEELLEQESKVLQLAKENAELLEMEQEKLRSIRESTVRMQQKLFAEGLKTATSWKDAPDPSDGASWNDILKSIRENYYAEFDDYSDRVEAMIREIEPVYGQGDLDEYVAEMLKIDWSAGSIVKGFLMSNSQLFIATTLIRDARSDALRLSSEVGELESQIDQIKDSMHSHAEAGRDDAFKIQEMETLIEKQETEIARLGRITKEQESQIKNLSHLFFRRGGNSYYNNLFVSSNDDVKAQLQELGYDGKKQTTKVPNISKHIFWRYFKSKIVNTVLLRIQSEK